VLPHKEHELKRALVSVKAGVGWLELVVAELDEVEVLLEDVVGWLELVVGTVLDDSEVLLLVLASPTLRAIVYWLVVRVTDVPTKGSVPAWSTLKY
jgi:hypothetical protein